MSFFNTASGSSVKFETQNVEFVGQISGPVTQVQDTVFGSRDELKFWKDGTPAMKALVPVTTQAGETQTLHVPASSRLHKAIGAALGAAGASDLEQGGVLGITWTGYAAGKNPSNPPKDYSVRYITAADVAAQAA
ncbi:hypothetical protein [Arthrobacter sp. ISL-95]|uniref:hypothetical protein n=1 Tax=Arthrobacter sp. ISL-95 TaxID=2819116 RepID=UPI001BEA0520|nr:hypothetical protein [Arthrobacter sp. ISL-95]MBT2587985.1 hypothetical protein [Arthrobacter sp. ISL-95]